MPRKARKPPLVEVTWRDAYRHNEAGTKEQTAKDTPFVERLSIGWFVHEDAEKLVIALTWDAHEGETAEYDDRLFIPRAYVKAIRYVERKPRGEHLVQGDAAVVPLPSKSPGTDGQS